jgi:biopolymer transport protein ExbD
VKNVWGLGAAVLSLLLLMVFWTVYVTGRLATTERLAPSETADGIEVPVIGTVGDFPEPEHRIVVNVTADGRIVVEGKTYSMTGLFDELKRLGDLDRGELLPGTNPPKYLSGAAVVLRADGALPWGSAQRFVEACAESGIWRISFAVRHEGDGAEGAIGFPLPRDKGCEDPTNVAWKDVDAVTAAEGGSPEVLHAALAESPASLTGKLGVRLRIDPHLPTRVALALTDAAIRTGAVRITSQFVRLDGPMAPAFAAFDAEVRSLRAAGSAYSLRLGDLPIVVPAVAMTPVSRVRGAAAVPAWSVEQAPAPREPEPVFVPIETVTRDEIPK